MTSFKRQVLFEEALQDAPQCAIFKFPPKIVGLEFKLDSKGLVKHSKDFKLPEKVKNAKQEHIEDVLEFIKENGFPAKNEQGSQFIHVRVPKPSRMQLEEIGDDVNRRTNAIGSRLTKIKTNTGLRIRAAVEKEFIDQPRKLANALTVE